MSNSSLDPKKEAHAFMSDKSYGTLLCLLSDALFSIVYIFVQFINKNTFTQDFIFGSTWRAEWILCFKEWIAAAFALPIFLYLYFTGKTVIPGVKVIIGLIVAAFFCEYIGIGHHVLANDYIGMALGLPVIRTITILGCAIFGAILLKERITSMKVAMILVLISAVGLFGYSNFLASTPVAATDVAEKIVKYGSWNIPCDIRTFGFICAFITGMGYAIYTLILRAVMKKPELKEGEEAPKPVSAYFVVSMVFGFGGLFGFIAMLGKMKAAGESLSALTTAIPAPWWYCIIAAGVLTFVAFYLKNLSYRYASASKAAAMSVLQVLLNICAGMLIFHEPTNPVFWGGAVLTVVGIILASRTN
ncbi:MAG: EamA family transporter [Planctomycetia bacterium]|nr:EamA family transporter [Planctomycetia bacterium]